MAKKKTTNPEDAPAAGPRRISLELSDEITAEIEELAKKTSMLSLRDLRELVREHAKAAAESSLAGRIGEIVRARLVSELGE